MFNYLFAYQLRIIMESQTELAARITAATAAIAKIGTETATLIEKVTELEDLLAAQPGGVSIEVAEALAALEAQVRVVDDLVPDAPAEPEPEPEA